MKSLIAIIGSVFLASLFVGCSSSSDPSMGSVKVHLTDAPSCGYEHVYITVDHIEISTDGNAWTSIAIDPSVAQPIDLLNLTNGSIMTLGEAQFSPGTYQQVRLVLAANTGNGPTYANAIVLEGTSTQIPLKTPSAQQSGYKINGPITVTAGALSNLVLDFNACKSIVAAGQSGKYILKPVVNATAQIVSGTISGFALAGSHVSAYLEPDGTFITGTVVPTGEATAQFNLGPILQTTSTTAVDVVIVPPAEAEQGTIIVQGVPVVATQTTWISPQNGSSPFNSTVDTASAIRTVSGTVTINGTLGEANVVATQTITSSTRSYEIAATTSLIGTGVYSLSLAAEGPWLSTYSTTLPLSLTKDTADAGKYSIDASTELLTSLGVSVDISTVQADNVNFILAP